mmetsp:Transcript_44287/g.73775  ORF Transcript_44287/g.73775 Transcript_44287/m.73775 type:complete len:330 (+) Transcript_44287:229-1218(+)
MDAKRQKVEDGEEVAAVNEEEEEEEVYEGEEVMDDEEDPEDDEGEDEDEDRELEAALAELQDVQDNLEKINDEASDKVLEVEQKYNEVRRPVHKKRNDIIKRIPEFWATTFSNHPSIGQVLTESDRHIFTFLTELDVQDSEDVKSGYTITFRWMKNPFFEDSVLQKVFTFEDLGTLTIEGTEINWKPGMDPAFSGGPSGKRDINSFFQWFYTNEELPNGVVDEIAVTIKDDIWVSPLKYFHAEMSEGEPYGRESDEDDDDDDDDNEDGGGEVGLGYDDEEDFDEEGDEEAAGQQEDFDEEGEEGEEDAGAGGDQAGNAEDEDEEDEDEE